VVRSSMDASPTAPRNARQARCNKIWRRSLVRRRRNATTLLLDRYNETVKSTIDAMDVFAC
jgi:hypothetical protein